jgi:hypothetical protein
LFLGRETVIYSRSKITEKTTRAAQAHQPPEVIIRFERLAMFLPFQPMTIIARTVYRPLVLLFSLVVYLGAGDPAWGQERTDQFEEFTRDSLLGREVAAILNRPPAGVNVPVARVPRVRLFQMPTGFLYENPGLDTVDEPMPDPADTGPPGNKGVLINMGWDNPYFDYRRGNDPGGVGYYRLESQVQLLDKGTSSLCFGLQALTPAGLDSGGLDEGPTVFIPALAGFQELGRGAALQGFVAKDVYSHSRWTGELGKGIKCGLALQCAIPGFCDGPEGLHFFLETLGRYRNAPQPGPAKTMNWDIIPGIHWRMGERWWMSVGAAKTGLVTCSWKF